MKLYFNMLIFFVTADFIGLSRWSVNKKIIPLSYKHIVMEQMLHVSFKYRKPLTWRLLIIMC